MKRQPAGIPRWLQRMRSREERELRLKRNERFDTNTEQATVLLMPGGVSYVRTLHGK